jgi:hypothetical protein
VKKQELQQKLIRSGVPDDMYRLNGGLPNEAYCLDKYNNFWEVYYSEKGIKSGLRQFKSEEEACDYFYDQIIKALNEAQAMTSQLREGGVVKKSP